MRNLHSLEIVEHYLMWIFRLRRGIHFHKLVDVVDGPPASEYPNEQPDKQGGGDGDPTSVTTEPSSAVRAASGVV